MEEAWIQALEKRKKQNLENKQSRPIHEVQGKANAPTRGERNFLMPQRRGKIRTNTTEEDKEEINRKAIAPNEIGHVEEDPTQGWGKLANKEALYNRIESRKQLDLEDNYMKAYKKTLKK